MRTRHILTFALATIGFVAFLILSGNETPGVPMTMTEFIGSKLAALAVIYGCIRIGKLISRRNIIAKRDNNKEQED